MRKLTRKCLAAGVAVTGVVAAVRAQDPAPAARFVRAAAPDDRPPQQAMPGWLAGPTSTAVRPLTGAEQAAAAVAPVKKPSLAESTYAGVRSFVSPPPGQPPTPTPLPQGMVPPQYAASPGVYAGPPAYRWYGYGAVTPGRNPHAPDGVSPRGSPNWLAQSGATPGAFPVTVTAGGQPTAGQPVATRELPSYSLGNVASSLDRPAEPVAASYPAPVASPPEAGQPLPATVIATVEPASLSTPFAAPEATPLPALSPLPLMPAPGPTPVAEPPQSLMPTVTPPPRLSEPPAFNPTAAAPVPAPAGPQPLLTWTSTSTDPEVAFSGAKSPAAATVVAAAPLRTVTPVTPTVTSVAPTVVPASAVLPVTPLAPAVATPTWGAAKPLGRSQGPGEAGAPTLEQAVRNAAYGFATVLEVRHTGPSAVTVRLRAATVADARSAAELVSKLPALKPLAVEFAVTVGK